MSLASDLNQQWINAHNPATQEAAQATKKSFVTNYIKGQVADVSLPRVAIGGVVPFILGREIIRNPDIIWYGNLKPIIETKTQQTTTTDPNTGVETITTTITTNITGYTIDVQFCVGIGPGARLRSILLDNVAAWSGTEGPTRATFSVDNNPQIKDVIFAGGNFDQAVDPYLQAVILQQIPAYRGIAYVVLLGLDVSKLGNLAFEVDRYPDPLGLGAANKIGDDINPVSAAVSIITAKWGGAGRDIATIGSSFATLAAKCFDEANGCSITARNVVSANDLNGILLDQIDATMWEDHETGKLELTVYRKDFERENLVRVFDKDIIRIDQMDKTSWQSVPTSLTLKYVDRAQSYTEIPVVARNLATSDKISKSVKELSFPAVRVSGLAAKILAREGAISGSPVQQIQLTTNRKTAACNPGDIVLITCEKYRYFSVPAIVAKRRTQPVEDNSVTLVCNVILYPNNNVLFASPGDSFFVPVDPNPHAPTAVKVFSAPWAFKSSKPVLDYGVGGSHDFNYSWNVQTDQLLFFGNAYSASQQIMRVRYHDVPTSTDIIIETFNTVPTSDFLYQGYARLTTAIDKYDNWDGSSTTDTIVIKNIGPAATGMANVVSNFNAGGYALIMIDNEIFTCTKAVGTSIVFSEALRTATFTGVQRALGDTVAQDHAVNADVMISSVLTFGTSKIGFPFGASIDYKCTSLASPKNELTESPLAAAFAISYTGTDRANRPLRPHNTKINASRGTSTPTALALGATPAISWNIRGRSIANTFTPKRDFPWQTDVSQPGEVLAAKHIVYRVWIEDSAAVEWDCGATADTADTTSLLATIPLGAAPGDGWLWVDAEFDNGVGVQISQFKDRLPITLS